MNKEELVKIIKQYTMDSSEVLEYLGISKQRLSDMKRNDKIVEVKKGIFLREEVEAIKMSQQNLRRKYNEKTAYDLFPVYKYVEGILIINKLRFFDCVTMVKYKDSNEIYNQTLERTLSSILEEVEKDEVAYLLNHERFDYIENKIELEEQGEIVKEFTQKSFKEFLEYDEASIIGLDKIGNYKQILKRLNQIITAS